jgi:hypothetical protein
MGGKLAPPIISTGTRPLKRERSSSTGCAERLRFATHNMDSSSCSLRYASTLRLPGCKNSSVPRPNARCAFLTAMMRFIQFKSEPVLRPCASTFTDW